MLFVATGIFDSYFAVCLRDILLRMEYAYGRQKNEAFKLGPDVSSMEGGKC